MADVADDLDGLELLPATDEALDGETALAAAAESVLAEDEPDEVLVPFGRTWLFDWEHGRFVRDGLAPKEVRGTEALAVWAGMAMHAARYAHPVFGPDFGMEYPESVIGQAVDLQEPAGDWGARAEEALQAHDRVTGIEDFEAHWEPDEGVIVIDTLEVLTDAESTEENPRLTDLQIGNFLGV
jgi:hypothetical protein